MKKVLSIAGSDCSGGAGIQADLKTFSAHGVFGMSVIVSVVAENTSRVIDIQDITPDMIAKQIDAVFEDIEVNAVKIGMLSTPECMKAVAMKLLQYKPQNIVIDPVMYAKNGCPLMNPAAVSTLIDTVIPLADVLTPNIPEAEKIADMQISTVSDMEAAARKIYAIPFHCQPAAAHPVAWRKPLPDFQFVSCSAPSFFINDRTPSRTPGHSHFVTLQQPMPETGCYPCFPSGQPSAHPPKAFLPNGRYE